MAIQRKPFFDLSPGRSRFQRNVQSVYLFGAFLILFIFILGFPLPNLEEANPTDTTNTISNSIPRFAPVWDTKSQEALLIPTSESVFSQHTVDFYRSGRFYSRIAKRFIYSA